MKITKLLVVVFVILSSLPVLAQQANANAQQNTSAQTSNAQASGSGAADANVTRSGRNVQAQGSGNADSSASLVAPGSSHREAPRTARSDSQPMRPSNRRAVAQGRAPQPNPRARKSSASHSNALNASSAGAANGAITEAANQGTLNAAGAGNAVASGAAQGNPGGAIASATGAASGSGSAAANGNRLNAASASAANAFANGTANLQPVSGQLIGKLDSKSAKVGQQVVLKTTQAFRTADGTMLPKGTHLLGHVTSVRPHRSKRDDGDLGIEFDRALLKGGRTVPIHSVIESVAPPANAFALADSGSDDLFANQPMGGGMVGGGGAMGGGGLVGGRGIGGGVAGAGGLASAPARTMNTSLAGSGNGFASAGRNTVGTAGNLGSAASGSANGLRGSAAGAGMMAAHATAIPGVVLGGDAAGTASGMLTATRKNVHLDSGTQMVLGIAGAAHR